MNKKILTIAITCFSCLLLITGFAVADKPEGAGKPEWVETKKAEREVEREARMAEWKAERDSKRAEWAAEREARKAEKEKD